MANDKTRNPLIQQIIDETPEDVKRKVDKYLETLTHASSLLKATIVREFDFEDVVTICCNYSNLLSRYPELDANSVLNAAIFCQRRDFNEWFEEVKHRTDFSSPKPKVFSRLNVGRLSDKDSFITSAASLLGRFRLFDIIDSQKYKESIEWLQERTDLDLKRREDRKVND